MSWLDIIFVYVLPLVVVLLVPMHLPPGLIYLERRICAFIQDRAGPNRVDFPLIGRIGGLLPGGLFQPMADAVKLLTKEDITPARADKVMFNLAPLFSLVPPFVVFAVIPFSRPYAYADAAGTVHPVAMQAANPEIGMLFILAVLSLSAYGIAYGGWASNSRYSLLGALRASAQMISYEVGMGLSLLSVFMITGALNLQDIVTYQAVNGWYVLTLPGVVAFFMFMTCAFAENNRLPFDLAECESELVGGFHTEYSAMKFGMFFQGEYIAMSAMSAIMVALFFGGWHIWGMDAAPTDSLLLVLLSIAVFFGKWLVFVWLYIQVRWTLPRFRYDQLMDLGWKGVIPISIGVLVFQAIWLAWKEGNF